MEKYVVLADIVLDINGGEYSHFLENILLGIKKFKSKEEAIEFGRKELHLLAENDNSILTCDSEINIYTLNKYMELNNG